jgi:activator of HSP90 ATPase
METKTINQEFLIQAPADAIYETLMNEEKHAALTHSFVKISPEVGDEFSACDGGVHGKILNLIPDERIELAWRAEEDCWPKDHYSWAIFELVPTAEGTKIVFTQHGVPDECYETIAQGWFDYYWYPMKERLEA